MATSEQHSGSKATSVILVNSLLLGLATIAMAARLSARGLYLKAFGLDDVFCLLGYIFTFGLCFICAWMVRYGYGRHIETLTPYDLTMFLKLDFASEILYIFAFVTIKMSFLFFYLRIFPGRTVARACYFLIAFLACQCIEEVAVVIFQCSPIKKAWNPELEGKCLELLSFFYVSFGIKLGTDLFIFILPIPILWHTKLPRGKKLGVCSMFLLGLLICVTSIIRATFLTNTSTDISWILVAELNWSSVEVCVAVICACIPSFKALLSSKFPSIHAFLGLASSRDRTGSNKQQSYGPNFSTKYTRHIRLDDMAVPSPRTQTDASSVPPRESEEHIMKPENRIRVTTDFVVTEAG